MKFGKSLSNQIEETLPDWRDKFLSYKELKKRLNPMAKSGGEKPSKRPRLEEEGKDVVVVDMTREENDFIRLLETEIDKFNGFFVDKEEEYIIKLKELQVRKKKADESDEEFIKVRKDTVDFHGEMVLLENYSALNYTGLVKILKKYDKRTGSLIRLPFIQKLLQQPFYTTDLLSKLVKECETMLDQLFPISDLSVPTEVPNSDQACNSEPAESSNDGLLRGPKDLAEIEYMQSLYMKSTVSALRALKEIRSRSSTVSVFSLPPMQNTTGVDESWNQVPILEQIAK